MLPALVLAQLTMLIDAQPKEEKPEPVTVRAKPLPRSASDWQVDADTLGAAPHETGVDVLGTLPGVFVSNRGLLGQAPHLSLRGFEGTSGQDMELFVGNVPMNQVSNVRAPGYADLRLVMPEAIHSVRISHGPYDPRQGDFAIAGSAHMDLGLAQPGFLAKGTLGSFGSRRVLLAFAPDNYEWRDSFAAVETYATEGPGGGRGGQRSSLVAQLAANESRFVWHGFLAVGSARFDFPGLLSQTAVSQGEYPYDAIRPLGRDLTQQAHVGSEFVWEVDEGALTLGFFLSKTKMLMHENLTGYVLDLRAGLPPTNSDDFEQVNEALTYGVNTSYRHQVTLLSKRDVVEVGAVARVDSITQTETRLFPDGTINARTVDAAIDVLNVGAYLDAALYPFKRVVLRGGTRVDSISDTINDRTGNQGLERTAQGVHVGNKAVIDYAAGQGVHLVASYGEGFRSPQARELTEGQPMPFATIQSFEAGARVKRGTAWQASLVGFASWLSRDRVFDPIQLENVPAPSSRRVGASTAMTLREGIFGMSANATFVRAVFTASDDRFTEGSQVPYAPAFVLRDDAFVETALGRLGDSTLVGRLGMGLQGTVGTALPGGAAAKEAAYIDALASASWRWLEVSINGMNLLGGRYYDVEYVYVSNFEKSPTLPPPAARVLVATPTSVFVTLQIHVGGPHDTPTNFRPPN
jgi:iron complex outermembrane recepter protein